MSTGQNLSRAERERRSADIRAWAEENWTEDLNPRGRIPADVVAAYYQAQGIPTGPPTDPQDSPLRGDSPPPGDDARDSDVSRETSESPADEDDVPRDPPPSRPRGRTRRTRSKAGGGRRRQAIPITDEVRDEVRANLALLTMVPLLVAEHRDPVCGGALSSVKDDLLDWCTAEVCRSQSLVQYFVAGEEIRRFVVLGMILRPVLQTLWAHHVTHTIGEDDDGGDNAGAPPDQHAYTADPGLYVAAAPVSA